MHAVRHIRSGWLPVIVVVSLLGAGTLGWLAWEERAAGLRAGIALRAKHAERDRFMVQDPQPSAASELLIREELAAVQRAILAHATTLGTESNGIFDSPVPAKPVDAYFELAAYVEKNRALAAAARTTLSENERFGFATHATQGPAEELLPSVTRQSAAMRHLLERLFEAAPHGLLAVQRERPLTAGQLAMRRAGGVVPASGGPAGEFAPQDFFTLDPALSLFVPGETDTMAFRVEFTGRTASLRGFLNSLATSPAPLFVRSVEVEPLASVPSVSAADTTLPVVVQNVSKFAVVVELVELVRRPTVP